MYYYIAADWAGQGLVEEQCILAELRGGPRDLWSCTDILQLQFPVGKSNTRSSLSVQGAINVTHPQSPLSPCLYNFVVLRHVIQWLIDWCLHLRCKSSEKSISFRFFIFYFFFAFHSVIFAFRVQILTKTLARKKGHCPANDWPEMCKGLETYIQWDNLCSADSEDCTVEVLCLNINLL